MGPLKEYPPPHCSSSGCLAGCHCDYRLSTWPAPGNPEAYCSFQDLTSSPKWMLSRFLESWLSFRDLKSFSGLSPLLRVRDHVVLFIPSPFPGILDLLTSVWGVGCGFCFIIPGLEETMFEEKYSLDSVVSDISCLVIWTLVQGCRYIFFLPIHNVSL